MEFKEMNISQLSALWEVSEGNVVIRNAIENELEVRRANNNSFSIEYIYKVCKKQNHAMNVTFIPASEAYKSFGKHITMDILVTEEEALVIYEHMYATPPINTYGYVKAKSLISNELTNEQAEELAYRGFHTGDIAEVWHL